MFFLIAFYFVNVLIPFLSIHRYVKTYRRGLNARIYFVNLFLIAFYFVNVMKLKFWLKNIQKFQSWADFYVILT